MSQWTRSDWVSLQDRISKIMNNMASAIESQLLYSRYVRETGPAIKKIAQHAAFLEEEALKRIEAREARGILEDDGWGKIAALSGELSKLAYDMQILLYDEEKIDEKHINRMEEIINQLYKEGQAHFDVLKAEFEVHWGTVASVSHEMKTELKTVLANFEAANRVVEQSQANQTHSRALRI